MCEYDDVADFSVTRLVKKTRVPHRCRQCRLTFEKGVSMFRWSIGWDGTARTLYLCKVCEFMSHQLDTSPLHICLDTSGSDPMRPGDLAYEEVKTAFAEGRAPDPSRVPLRVY